jgi:hypothetical protein
MAFDETTQTDIVADDARAAKAQHRDGIVHAPRRANAIASGFHMRESSA